VNGIDYLLKPYTLVRFEQAVERVSIHQAPADLHKLVASKKDLDFPSRILVEQGSRLISIITNNILWLEPEGDYTIIHTMKQHFLSNKGISELETRLDPQLFRRVHRSAIIALHAIQEIYRQPAGPQIILKNGTIIKVSCSYTHALQHF
jgi:two-component system, LytTR family, response regulator